MIYLISQLWVWLLLALVFAAIAGWAFAAERAAPAQASQRRERENLLSDLLRLASEDAGGAPSPEGEREADSVRRQLELRNGRIAELERALEHARARADDLAGEMAELQRRGPGDSDQSAELARLRALVADHDAEQARTIDVETAPVEEPSTQATEDEIALQTWRLRYFEQRVRYLEGQARASAETPAPLAALAAPETPLPEWRAREAEARAQYLEEKLREATTPAPIATVGAAEETTPFAADADVDVLLRWRLLYLERRVAYLQDAAAAMPVAAPQRALAPSPAADLGPDPDRWKWRARYLEARVRHLEERAAAAPLAATSMPQPVAAPVRAVDVETPPAPPPRTRRGVKPPVLAAARNGAPDDLTLIDSVSQLQQGTLNALGVFHFDQIAAWSPDHIAWVDGYLRLQGRIEDEEWIEQAQALAEEGPRAARRIVEESVD